LRLALESRQALRVARELIRQDLQRDFAVQSGIPCAVHIAHAAGAENGNDIVGTEALTRLHRHETLHYERSEERF
jgi:hypothetical protein